MSPGDGSIRFPYLWRRNVALGRGQSDRVQGTVAAVRALEEYAIVYNVRGRHGNVACNGQRPPLLAAEEIVTANFFSAVYNELGVAVDLGKRGREPVCHFLACCPPEFASVANIENSEILFA